MHEIARPIVGREREIEVVEQLLEGTCAGDARFVFVTGEPGIGKTRLLAELLARAEERDCLALYGGAAEFERELPFGLVVDAIDEYLETIDPLAFQRLAGEDLTELAGVFPALRSLDRSDQPSTAAERFRAHRAVCGLFEHLAARQPLVLALDDLHWADGASLELISHLLRRPPRAAVMVAATFRRGQIGRALVSTIERGMRRRTAGSTSVRCRVPRRARSWPRARRPSTSISTRKRWESPLSAGARPSGGGGEPRLGRRQGRRRARRHRGGDGGGARRPVCGGARPRRGGRRGRRPIRARPHRSHRGHGRAGCPRRARRAGRPGPRALNTGAAQVPLPPSTRSPGRVRVELAGGEDRRAPPDGSRPGRAERPPQRALITSNIPPSMATWPRSPSCKRRARRRPSGHPRAPHAGSRPHWDCCRPTPRAPSE